MKKYKVNLKTSYDDLTVGDYQKIYKLNKETSNVRLLEILSDKTREEIEGMPIKVVNSLIDELEFIYEDVPEVDVIDPVTCGGYGWEISQDIEELTAGQFIGLTELSKDSDKLTENLHLILAVILNKYRRTPWWKFWKKWERIPYTERDTKSIMKDSELIKREFPVKNAITISSFFLSIFDLSQQNTEAFSQQVQQKVRTQNKNQHTETVEIP